MVQSLAGLPINKSCQENMEVWRFPCPFLNHAWWKSHILMCCKSYSTTFLEVAPNIFQGLHQPFWLPDTILSLFVHSDVQVSSFPCHKFLNKGFLLFSWHFLCMHFKLILQLPLQDLPKQFKWFFIFCQVAGQSYHWKKHGLFISLLHHKCI